MSIAKELGYKRYFNVQELFCKIIGVDLTKKFVKHPYLLVLTSLTYVLIICSYTLKNRSNTDRATESLAGAAHVCICTFKSAFLVVNQKQIIQLIHSIWKMSKADDVEEHAIISDLNTKAYYISNTIVMSALFAYLFSLMVPLLIAAVIYVATGEVIFSPLYADIFVASSGSFEYILVQTIMAVTSFIGSCGGLACDTLYIWFVLNLTAQFRVLNMRIKRVASIKNVNEMNCAVIECIRFHQRIIAFAENFDLAYRSINFTQFAIGCAPLCFVGFQLTMGTGNKMFFLTYMISSLIQMGMYCVHGQWIQDESYNVADNIYEAFAWEKLPKISRQLLLITMTRAQKCCNLTGIFFVIDISLFVWVYKTRSSYITILWTIAANSKE